MTTADDLTTRTSTSTPPDRPAPARAGAPHLLGTLLVVLGLLMALGGAGTWVAVSAGLASENVVVADTAPAFVGATLDTPWEAWAQTEAIRTDILAATDGRLYADMDREDPMRDMVATGTFLRASLLTSVVAFGVALALVGVGLGFVLGGMGLRRLAARPAA